MGKEILKFIKHFLPLIIITGIALIIFAITYSSKAKKAEETAREYYVSPNTERVYGDRRVFDYADQLTDEQEASLEAYIHEAEQKTLCDIVIVTLNQSLANYEPEYMSRYDMEITPDKYVMVYADKFWEDNRFGYDSPQVLDGTTSSGDGVLLVDNLFREPETGKIYTWMCTTGIVEEYFSSSMIDYVLDAFYNQIDYDYYEACIDFVDEFVFYMDIDDAAKLPSLGGHYLAYFIGIIILIGYFFAHLKSKDAAVTTTSTTYIVGHEPDFLVNEDIYLRKSVTKRYNPPSSSSSGGGGGHHSSGGGGSHGGGGHSR